jgi:hypothetical protein
MIPDDSLAGHGHDGRMNRMPQANRDKHPTQPLTPLVVTINRILERKAARPHDVYRLAVIVEALLDSLQDPAALDTIRGELRVLLYDLSQSQAYADEEE